MSLCDDRDAADESGAREAREVRRQEALASYDVLGDAPGDGEGVRRDLMGLVALAARACGVPMATINLLTTSEQHQVASVGFEGSVSDRADSMCAVVVDEAEPVVLADARLDPRFRENPWVTGAAGVRFYATHQLVTPAHIAVGTLCVFDSRPRVIDEQQRTLLAGLAERVVDVLELELRSRQLRRAVREGHEARAELERSNTQLAAFAGQVSHDLRTPLAALTMSLGLMQERLAETPTPPVTGPAPAPSPDALAVDLTPLVERAVGTAERMGRLIDDVLGYASLGGRLQLEEVDVAAALADVLVDLGAAAAGARVSVGDLPVVRADAKHLRVVLQNLLSNAVKFVPAGEAPVVEVAARPTDLGWRIDVVDHGIGVPPGHAERVFEPFARAATAYPGWGIGLATCSGLVLAHGGRIGHEDTPGGGATFWVELPGVPPA